MYFCSLSATKSAISEQKIAFEDFIDLYSTHSRTVSIPLREILLVSIMVSRIQKKKYKAIKFESMQPTKRILDTKKRRSCTFSQLILTPDSVRWDSKHDVEGVSTMKSTTSSLFGV